MKTPTKISWTVSDAGGRNEEWEAIDEHGKKHGRVRRQDNGHWFWHAMMAFCHGVSRRRRGAMHLAEQAILRDWPTEVQP